MLSVSIKKQLNHLFLDVDFEVKDEVVVLFGPSGSGKTTILNIIAGLSNPDDGQITLEDIIYYKRGKKPLPVQNRKIGYLFQDYALFPHMTVEKNILYGLKGIKNVSQIPNILKLLDVLKINHLLPKWQTFTGSVPLTSVIAFPQPDAVFQFSWTDNGDGRASDLSLRLFFSVFLRFFMISRAKILLICV